jgi:hypothetical protein
MPRPLFKVEISTSDNLKAFSASLTFLRSVGKELQVEVNPESLVLRGLNDAKTAYASVEFSRTFFDNNFSLNVNAMGEAFGHNINSQESSFSCKLPIKYICSLTKSFRNSSSVVMYAQADGASGSHELVLEMSSNNTSHHSIKRTHRFKYSDCDIVSAVFDEEGTCSLRSMNKILIQLLEHMHGAPEVMVSATERTFKVQSYYRVAPTALAETSRHLDTDLSVSVEDFDFYDFCTTDANFNEVGSNGSSMAASNFALTSDGKPLREVVVSKREWRALLQLSDTISCDDVAMNFIHQGQPIKLMVQHESLVVTLIMTSIQSQSSASTAIPAPATQDANIATQSSSAPTPPRSKTKGSNLKQSASSSRSSNSIQRSRSESKKVLSKVPSPPSTAADPYPRSDTDNEAKYGDSDDEADTQKLMNNLSKKKTPVKSSSSKKATPLKRYIVVDSDDDDTEPEQPEPVPKKRKTTGRLNKTGSAAKTLLNLGGNGVDEDQSQSLEASSQDTELGLGLSKLKSSSRKDRRSTGTKASSRTPWDEDSD